MATAPKVVNDDTRNTYMKFRGKGSIYRRGGVKTYTIRWYDDGVRREESTGTRDFKQAKRLLAMRQGSVARGEEPEPKLGKLRFDEALDAVMLDYKVNSRKSIDDAESRIRLHLLPYSDFGRRRMKTITAETIKQYQAHRQDEGAAAATINREVALVKRAFSLAYADRKIHWKPQIHMLPEPKPVQNFFEPDQVESLIANLPEALRGPITLANWCGWRVHSEILPLQWHQVDRRRKSIYLNADQAKNNEPKDLPYEQIDELVEVIEKQWQERKRLIADGKLCPFVFHRNGKEIKDFRRAWKAACTKAGLAITGKYKKVPHDFRRTAARNLIEAGVPEQVAMKVTGHKSRESFRRYSIIAKDDVKMALGKVAESKRGQLRGQLPKLGEIEQFEDRAKMAVNS